MPKHKSVEISLTLLGVSSLGTLVSSASIPIKIMANSPLGLTNIAIVHLQVPSLTAVDWVVFFDWLLHAIINTMNFIYYIMFILHCGCDHSTVCSEKFEGGETIYHACWLLGLLCQAWWGCPDTEVWLKLLPMYCPTSSLKLIQLLHLNLTPWSLNKRSSLM